MLKQKSKQTNKTKQNKIEIKKMKEILATHDRFDTRTWRVWRCRPSPGLWSTTPLFGRCPYVNRTQRGGRGEKVPRPPPDPPCSCNKSSSDWLQSHQVSLTVLLIKGHWFNMYFLCRFFKWHISGLISD